MDADAGWERSQKQQPLGAGRRELHVLVNAECPAISLSQAHELLHHQGVLAWVDACRGDGGVRERVHCDGLARMLFADILENLGSRQARGSSVQHVRGCEVRHGLQRYGSLTGQAEAQRIPPGLTGLFTDRQVDLAL